MKPTANLNKQKEIVTDGNDSIVIVNDLGGIVGGRALDVSSVPSYTKVIRAGHIIVKNADGGYSPLGVSGGSYVKLPDGARYTGVLKNSVPVSDPRAAILTAGQVNAAASPYPVNAEIIAALPMIQFLGAAISPAPTPPTPTESPMYFEAVEANSTVSMISTLETAPYLEYSTDGVTWQEWQHTTTEVHTFDTLTLTAVGDRVYLRGDNPNGLASFPEGAFEPIYSHFRFTGTLNGGGNIMSLLDHTMALTEVPRHGFYSLFSNFEEGFDTALLTLPSMKTITSIGESGCNYMCYCCESLISAADMTSLTRIDEFGCAGMYDGCTSLTSAADMPSLVSIDNEGCGEMYKNCTFNMSEDGTTLNFDFPAPPVTAGAVTYPTAYYVATWMGNTNGFIT